MTPLLASMQDQIDTLKQELEDWKEEARRKDAILMTRGQRIPELEAPAEPREASEKGSEEPGGVVSHPTSSGSHLVKRVELASGAGCESSSLVRRR